MSRSVESDSSKLTGWVDAEFLLRAYEERLKKDEEMKMRSYVPKLDPKLLRLMRREAAWEKNGRSDFGRKLTPPAPPK